MGQCSRSIAGSQRLSIQNASGFKRRRRHRLATPSTRVKFVRVDLTKNWLGDEFIRLLTAIVETTVRNSTYLKPQTFKPQTLRGPLGWNRRGGGRGHGAGQPDHSAGGGDRAAAAALAADAALVSFVAAVGVITLLPFATLPFKIGLTPTFLEVALLIGLGVWAFGLARRPEVGLVRSPLDLGRAAADRGQPVRPAARPQPRPRREHRP